jgi:predicted DCC family thiol-disulfide oxidoreductase YuxK
MSHPILLYDGICGLCNRLVRFILRRDPEEVFRFASLQSALAAGILARHGKDAGELDSVYVVKDYGLPEEQLLARSDAVIFILRNVEADALGSGRMGESPVPTRAKLTGALWRFAGFLLQFVPRWFRNWGYGVIARNRYRVFGRYDTCPLPTDETRPRFLDLD